MKHFFLTAPTCNGTEALVNGVVPISDTQFFATSILDTMHKSRYARLFSTVEGAAWCASQTDLSPRFKVGMSFLISI